jgi:hypothetical protein
MKIVINLVAALLFFAVSGTAYAEHSFSRGDVTVTHPWSRPTPPGVPMGVGYMAISNQGDTAITLVGATTPKAGKVTMHESRMKDGMMSMRPLTDGLIIPAGETVMLKPHGYHLMLEGLEGAVAKGESFPMTLNFDTAETMQIELYTMPMDESAMGDQGMDH